MMVIHGLGGGRLPDFIVAQHWLSLTSNMLRRRGLLRPSVPTDGQFCPSQAVVTTGS